MYMCVMLCYVMFFLYTSDLLTSPHRQSSLSTAAHLPSSHLTSTPTPHLWHCLGPPMPSRGPWLWAGFPPTTSRPPQPPMRDRGTLESARFRTTATATSPSPSTTTLAGARGDTATVSPRPGTATSLSLTPTAVTSQGKVPRP